MSEVDSSKVICPNCCRQFSAIGLDDQKARSDDEVRIERLQRFKDSVHRTLDSAGVPTDPPGKHRDAGCRIGQRLEVVFTERDRLRKALTTIKTIDKYGAAGAVAHEALGGGTPSA